MRFIVQLISINAQKLLTKTLPVDSAPQWYFLGGDKYLLTVHNEYSNITRFILGASPNVGFFDFIRDISTHDVWAQEVVLKGGELHTDSPLPPKLSGEGTIISISDTGVDFSHPGFSRFKKSLFGYTGFNRESLSLTMQARRKETPYIELHLTLDGSSPTETDGDDGHNGHGTGMSYLAVGNVPPLWVSKSEFIFIDLMKGSQDHLILPPSLSDLLTLLYDQGSRIFSNSWGSSTPSYTFQAMEFDEFAYLHDDFLFITSAGNDGPRGRTITSPAVAKNGLTVGASQNSKLSFFQTPGDVWTLPTQKGFSAIGSCENIADFSSRGPTQDGRIKPDICAPGEFILSARSHPEKNESSYVYGRGTSPACQIVSKFAAILREILRKTHNLKTPSSSLLKGVFVGLAIPLHGVSACMLYSNKTNTYGAVFKTTPLGVMDQGFGRLFLPENPALFMKDRVLISTFEQKNYNITSLEDGELSIVLSWLDPPSTPYSGKKDLINDLNLRVIIEEEIHLGNSQEDSLNNLERVRVFVKKGQNILINISPKGPLSPFKGIEPKFSLIVSGKKVTENPFPIECTPSLPPLQCFISGEIGGRGCYNNKWETCHGECAKQKGLFWVKEECKCLQDIPCDEGGFIRKCREGVFPAPCPEKIQKKFPRPPPRALTQLVPHVWVTWVEIFSISLFLVGVGMIKKKKGINKPLWKL